MVPHTVDSFTDFFVEFPEAVLLLPPEPQNSILFETFRGDESALKFKHLKNVEYYGILQLQGRRPQKF